MSYKSRFLEGVFHKTRPDRSSQNDTPWVDWLLEDEIWLVNSVSPELTKQTPFI